MRNLQKNALVLVAIAAIAVTILAFIKEITKEDYKRTMQVEENKTRKSIYPEANTFKKIKLKSGEEAYLAIKDGKQIGIIVKGSGRGFGGDVVIALGVNLAGTNKGKIHGLEILKHNETPGLGTKAKAKSFRNGFVNKSFKMLPEGSSDFKKRLGIDTITGATITSMAVLNAVKDAFKKINKYIKINGANNAPQTGNTNAGNNR